MLCPSCAMKNSLESVLRIRGKHKKLDDDDLIFEVDANSAVVATITKNNGSKSPNPFLGMYRAVPTGNIF